MKTVKDMMRERQDDLAKLLALIEQWDIHAESYAQYEQDELGPIGSERIREWAHIRHEVYSKCADDLRKLLRLDPPPSAAKPESKP